MSSSVSREAFPVVHAVTDSAALARPDFLARAESIMRALTHRGAIHLRSTSMPGRRFHDVAGRLAELQAATGCWLIVNDRVDVGRAVMAKGIQLASHSLGVIDAHRVAPDVPLGSSIHSVEEARKAEADGAAWCVAGTVFETPSHPDAKPGRVAFVEQLAAAISIPIVAIGGIDPSDVSALVAAGAHGIAIIRGAGWGLIDRGLSDEDPARHTRLFALPQVGFAEPVTRYISAYDASAGNGRHDHPHGKRSTEGTGAA